MLVKFWRTSRPFPLGKVTAVAIGANRAYVGMGDSATILTYRLDGTLLSAIETGLLPRPTTESDREYYRMLDTLGQDSLMTRGAIKRWQTFEFPATLPAYSSLRVDGNDLL